jgi:hypothetical protein
MFISYHIHKMEIHSQYLLLFSAYFPKIKEAYQIISLCVCANPPPPPPVTFESAGRFS